MNVVQLVKVIIKDSVQRSMGQMGIERTLEVIESISNVKQRLWMREAYYELVSK